MRLTNEHLKERFVLLYALLFLGILIDSLISGADGTITEYFQSHTLSIASGGVILLLLVLGKPYFEYDSDGEVLIFKSRYFILERFFPDLTTTAEFPKRKLIDYKVKGFIRRTVTIKIKSKKGVTVRHFNITFLSRSKQRHLKKSLDKIKRQNRSAKEEN